jgi:hypothetical protein
MVGAVRIPRLIFVALALALCLAAAPAAVAKSGVRATLRGPVAIDARPGTTITIAWRLTTVESRGSRGFGASGIFVRLLSRTGAKSTKAYGRPRGSTLVARVKVPRGGIRRIRIGLDGWRYRPGRPRQYAPMYFRVVNHPRVP